MPYKNLTRLFVIVFSLAAADSATARTLDVGPGKEFTELSAADTRSQPGDTIRLTAGEHFDCIVIHQPDITIEGTGKPEDTVITDKTCAGKGLIVTYGARATVRNLTLTRSRVPDGNGAGIRAGAIDLTVENVRFINNQNGILADPDRSSTIIVRDSVFEQNGSCLAACAHGIYVGQIKLLHVEHSRFFETKQGHHIKSRAARTEVIQCDIADGPRGTASYAIELPNGGGLLARGNTIEKGPLADNHTAAIVIGAEGVTQQTPELRVEANSFRRDGTYPTFLVRNLTATEAVLIGNKLSGSENPGAVQALSGDGSAR
jgi:hypothetical protein